MQPTAVLLNLPLRELPISDDDPDLNPDPHPHTDPAPTPDIATNTTSITSTTPTASSTADTGSSWPTTHREGSNNYRITNALLTDGRNLWLSALKK